MADRMVAGVLMTSAHGRSHHHDGHGAVNGGLKGVPQDKERNRDQGGGKENHPQRVVLLGFLEEALRARFLPLRFFHQLNELGQGRFPGELRGLHLQAAVLVHRAGKKGIACLLVDGE